MFLFTLGLAQPGTAGGWLFCFHKPYYVRSGTVTLSQLRGHNRRGGEEQRNGERMKKEQEGRKRRERGQREGRVETEGDHLILTACSCVLGLQ